MQDDSFSRPVLFFSRQPDGSVRPLELATVREGFQALNRGLEGFCLNRPEWHLAFHHLSRAMLDPKPDRVQAAREALDLLASLTRMTAVDATKQRIAAQAERRSLH
jgi:hypothetical protein